MKTDPHPSAFVERLGMIVACALVAMEVFMTVAPYFLSAPQSSVRLIDQQQTILQSVFLVLVGYLWGNSAGNKAKDSTIEKQAVTIQAAQAALAPVAENVIPVAPNESVTVQGQPE